MAETLDDFEFKGKIGRMKYPWHEWSDGRIWRIRRHEDFYCDTKQMQNYLYHKANQFGLRVKTQPEDENTIVFKFIDKD